MEPTERSNISRCVAGEGLFGLGMGLVAAMTALPLLLENLGAGKIVLGLAFSICTAGWMMGQPVGLMLFGRKRRSKRFLVPWAFCCSVPTYAGMALAVLLLGVSAPGACAAVILLLLAVRFGGGGAVVPLWQDWQAMMFRRKVRGRAVGMIAGGSAFGVTVAALAAGAVRRTIGFPNSYALLFAGSALFCAAGLGFYAAVREPEVVRQAVPTLRVRDLFGRFARSFGEPNFRNYLIGRALLTLGAGGAAFYAVHFKSPDGGGLAESTVIAVGMFLTLPQAIASPILGRIGDRRGHKSGVLLGAVAQLGSIAVAFLGRGLGACILAFGLMGVAWASAWVSHSNMLFETCPHDSRAAHITLSNVFLGPFVLLVPLATGWMMANWTGVRAGLGVTLVPTVVGILYLLVVVKEPRTLEMEAAARAREAA
ncbi:MAG: hypothetical protein R6V05_00670 [Candidatus Brocadiia bacterium]